METSSLTNSTSKPSKKPSQNVKKISSGIKKKKPTTKKKKEEGKQKQLSVKEMIERMDELSNQKISKNKQETLVEKKVRMWEEQKKNDNDNEKGNTEVRKKTPEAVSMKKEKDLPGTSRLPDQQPTVRRNGEKQSSKISKLSQYFDFETTPDTEFRGKLCLIREGLKKTDRKIPGNQSWGKQS